MVQNRQVSYVRHWMHHIIGLLWHFKFNQSDGMSSGSWDAGHPLHHAVLNQQHQPSAAQLRMSKAGNPVGTALGWAGYAFFFGIVSICTLSLLYLFNPLDHYLNPADDSNQLDKQGRPVKQPGSWDFTDQLDLNYALYPYGGKSIPEFVNLRASLISNIASINLLPNWKKIEPLSVQFFGTIQVQHPGSYCFFSKTGNFCELLLDDESVLTSQPSTSSSTTTRGMSKQLDKGRHKFLLNYYAMSAPHALNIAFTGPQNIREHALNENDFRYFLGADLELQAMQTHVLQNKVEQKGLLGLLYDSADHTGKHVVVGEPALDFPWKSLPNVPFNVESRWSAQWVGKIMVPTTDDYSFSVEPDVMVKLWVDGKLLINNPTGMELEHADIHLLRDKKYTFELKNYSINTATSCRLYWTTRNMKTCIIPGDAFYISN